MSNSVGTAGFRIVSIVSVSPRAAMLISSIVLYSTKRYCLSKHCLVSESCDLLSSRDRSTLFFVLHIIPPTYIRLHRSAVV